MSETTLKIAMTSLVKVLRELLANMEEEQHAILSQEAAVFQQIMNTRNSLISLMHENQKVMTQEIESLKSLSQIECSEEENEKEDLINLALYSGEEDVEILTLRDQVLALMEKMEKQNMTNNLLLGNKANEGDSEKKYSHQYKPTKRRFPKKNPLQQKKQTVKTLVLTEES